MPEITPDLTDESRCISVHWTLPVQCVLPCSHRENWHEAWHPESGNRIRYRRTLGTFATEELHDGAWHDLEIPTPGRRTVKLKPSEVPDELVTLACEQAYGTPLEPSDDRRLIARALAAVLPEHEKQVRAKVAEEIEQNGGTGSGCLWNAATVAAAEIARGEGR